MTSTVGGNVVMAEININFLRDFISLNCNHLQFVSIARYVVFRLPPWFMQHFWSTNEILFVGTLIALEVFLLKIKI